MNMFRHKNANHPANDPNHPANQAARGGFMSRFRRHPQQQSYGPQGYDMNNTTHAYGPQGGYGTRQYYRDPYYEGSTRSDWDHYAVRHEEALIGDPIPIMDNHLNLASAQAWEHSQAGPYGSGPLANGPINHGYDDAHYNKRGGVFNNLTKRGVPMVGPVTANGPLPGNLSSGTVIEKNFVQGPGKRTRTGFVDDAAYGNRTWQSSAWGAEPLYENEMGNQGAYGHSRMGAPGTYANSLYGPGTGHWGSTPLYGNRDSREFGRATPLLPDNPWTHNELGRDWEDGYRRGTIPYSSINNAFVQAPVTENFVEYGPNGERIEGYRTRTVREDIVPPQGALGQHTESSTTKTTKDVLTPGNTNVPNPTFVPRGMPIPADAVGIDVAHHQPVVEVIEVLPSMVTKTTSSTSTTNNVRAL